jgi:hypothetical protein
MSANLCWRPRNHRLSVSDAYAITQTFYSALDDDHRYGLSLSESSGSAKCTAPVVEAWIRERKRRDMGRPSPSPDEGD